MSPNLKRAVLVTEDSRFWTHEGIDFDELKESMEVNIERMEFARGGSTITQQLAKNLYLSPSKNPIRKVREFLIARQLEAELSKQRILELYLNVIEWGDGIYGAEAAARTYFRKSASDLIAVGIRAARGGDQQSARARSRRIPTPRLLRRQKMVHAPNGRRSRRRRSSRVPIVPPPDCDRRTSNRCRSSRLPRRRPAALPGQPMRGAARPGRQTAGRIVKNPVNVCTSAIKCDFCSP